MQPNRGPVRYTEEEIVALVDYAGAFGDGPDIPDVDPAAGDLAAAPSCTSSTAPRATSPPAPGRRSAAGARHRT